MQVKDQLGRSLTFTSTPKRIVSLVPSQTELFVDFGLVDSLVGITKFCVHPADLRKQKTIIGGTKQVHYDRVAELRPDVIIANKEENTLQMVEQLESIAPVWISDIYTVQDSLDFVQNMGDLFEKQEKASSIIQQTWSSRNRFLDAITDQQTTKVAYLIWKKPFMVAGRNTFINALLEDNKFQNIITDPQSRYPEVSKEELKTADLVLLSPQSLTPLKEKDRQQLEDQLNKPVKLVDGEYFSWYGSRLAKAYEYFTHLH